MRTYYAEGSKTLAFEVAEQLGWQAPDHVVVPIASGSQLVKIDKGFRELHKVGLLDDEPSVRISGAQATGCSPVATAFAEGVDHVRPVRSPTTIAKSLAIGNPADGWYALDTVRSSGGAIGSVTDDEIVEGIRLLARTEGIFAETAGGVTIATLAKLAAEGVVRPDERVVAYVTGHGLKTIEAVSPRRRPDGHHRPDPRGLRRRASTSRTACSMAVTVRIPTQLRHAHRQRGRGRGRRLDGRRGAQGARRRPPRLRAPGSSTTRASCAGSSTSSWPTRTSASSRAWRPRSPTARPSRSCPAVAGG